MNTAGGGVGQPAANDNGQTQPQPVLGAARQLAAGPAGVPVNGNLAASLVRFDVEAGLLAPLVAIRANLPLKLLMLSSRENITEVAFKTIPSASKIEIKRVLESLYGLQVAKVNTLNMEGKKKRAKGSLAFYRRPDYKKAYVTLKEPVTLPADIFPMNMMEEKVVEGKDANKKQGSKR